jgi:retinol dehydrogenase-12
VARDAAWPFRMMQVVFFPIFYLLTKDMRHGAQTTLYTILEDERNLTKGGYYSDCKESWVTEFAGNMENARRLWEIS